MDINKKYRLNGALATLLFHAVIVVLLLLLAFTTPLPLPGEEGVEVNLGNTDQGMGREQPLKNTSRQETPPPQKQVTEPVEEEFVTQETEDAPSIETKEEVEPVEKVIEVVEEVPEPVKEEPKVNPAALYKGKSDNSNNSINEGITGDEGDQGGEHGNPDSDSYQGEGGMGKGMSHDLKGRIPKYLPKPSSTFSENGTVVVQITVNKYGKVVKAVAIDKGSNTTNASLRKLAEKAALKAVFNAKADAPEIQRGTITYHFVVKN